MSYLEMRFLIPQQVVEIIVGPNGSNMDRLHMEYRAVVNISKSSTSERVLTVGGMELLPICKLLQDLLTTVTAATFDMYGYESETDVGLLVDDSQIDALTNLEQLQMLVEDTGARVDVFPLCCPQSTDRVVRVCGMPVNVARCVFGLHTLLQQCPIDFSTARQYYDANNADASAAGDYGGCAAEEFAGAYSSDTVHPEVTESDIGATSAVQTKRYSMPENIKSAVTGRNGLLLAHVERESGASVLINDSGLFHCTVSITGSEEEISNARLLLQMCIEYFCVRVE